jgi:hypothetical protein
LLDAAGVTCSTAELAELIEHYASLREQIESFYAPAFVGADPLLVLVADRD